MIDTAERTKTIHAILVAFFRYPPTNFLCIHGFFPLEIYFHPISSTTFFQEYYQSTPFLWKKKELSLIIPIRLKSEYIGTA